jgi:hypothetical protein
MSHQLRFDVGTWRLDKQVYDTKVFGGFAQAISVPSNDTISRFENYKLPVTEYKFEEIEAERERHPA